MSATQKELDEFHQFASEVLAKGTSRSLSELAMQFQEIRERQLVNAAIRAGLSDIEHGRTIAAAVIDMCSHEKR